MDVQKLKNFKSVFKYFRIFVEKKQAVDDERDVRVDSFTCFQDIFRSTNIIFCYISELSLLDFKNYEKGLYYKKSFSRVIFEIVPSWWLAYQLHYRGKCLSL